MCCRRIHASRKREAPTIPRPRTRHGAPLARCRRGQNKNIENNPMQRKEAPACGAPAALTSGAGQKQAPPDLIPRQNAPRRAASGSLPGIFALSDQRAQGMPDARCIRSLVCAYGVAKQAHEVSQRSHRNDPAFPARRLTAYPDRAHRRSADLPPPPEELPPPARRPRQDVRTTRLHRPRQAPSSKAPFTSTATRPASVTSAKRPSEWDGLARDIAVIWVF
jgi:hypothetical protein